MVTGSYDESSDEMTISFVTPDRIGAKEHILAEGILALLGDRDMITAVRFARASKTVCKANSPAA